MTVSGIIENKKQRSMDFTIIVYDNPEKTNHEVDHSKSAQRFELYCELMLFFLLIPSILFIAALLKEKTKHSTTYTRCNLKIIKSKKLCEII